MITRPFNRLTAEPPLELIPSTHGYQIRWAGKKSFWAKITGKCVGSGSGSGSGSCTDRGSGYGSGSGSGQLCPVCSYAWVKIVEHAKCCPPEQVNSEHGEFITWPAIEITGKTNVPVGSVVWLTPSLKRAQYTFQFGGGGSSGTGFEFAYVLDDSPEDVTDGHVYYNASIPQFDNGTQEWEDHAIATKVWLITRVNQPLAKGDIITARFVGTATPNGKPVRDLYSGIKTRLTDPVTIQSSNPLDVDGNLYWPGKVQYWDNDLQQRKEGREVWVIDWLDELKAFRAGDKIIAYHIGDANPGSWFDDFGSGSGAGVGSELDKAKPLYMTFCSGINTKFLKCFDNQVLSRNGTIATIGTRVAFLDEECQEDTTLEGICTDS